MKHANPLEIRQDSFHSNASSFHRTSKPVPACSRLFPQQAGLSTFNSQVGCCSCCWVRDQPPDEDEDAGWANLPAPGVPCDGRCARRCRLQQSRGPGSAPGPAASARRRPESTGSTACSGLGVAHAHLSRLLGAAGALSPPPVSGRTAEATGSGGGASGECERRSKAQVYRPRPRRSGSRVAVQDPRLLSFLAQLLCYDPDKRLTPLQALAHPFFAEALPFPVLQPATTLVGEHPKQVLPVQSSLAARIHGAATPAGTSRRGLTAPAPTSDDKGRYQNVAGSDGFHEPSAHSLPVGCPGQKEESPSPCDKGCLIDPRRSRCEAAVSRTTCGRSGNGGRGESLEPLEEDAASTVGRLKVDSGPKGSCCSAAPLPPSPAQVSDPCVDVDPTAQLRRLAEIAEAMLDKKKTQDSPGNVGGDDGGSGNGSEGSGSLTPPPSRRTDFLNAAVLAKLDNVEASADRGVPATEKAWAGAEARATTLTNRRRRSRVLSPASLATLKSDLENRRDIGATSVAASTAMARAPTSETAGNTAAEGLGLRPLGTKSTATLSTPSRANGTPSLTRGKANRSSQGKKRSLPTTSLPTTPKRAGKKAVVADQKEEEEEADLDEENEDSGHNKRGGAPTEGPKRNRAAESNKSEAATPSRLPSGRTRTPRRAAIAAEAALVRLKEEDESSDGSLTL